jgi:hypothetical protein
LNAQIGFRYFFIPWAFPYKSKKLNILQIGPLQGLVLSLGKYYINLCLTKRERKRHIEAIERDTLPDDYYTVTETVASTGIKWYKLYINYYFNGDRRLCKLNYQPDYVSEYKDQPPTKKEIYRQIMLNDSYRWQRLYKTDQIEVSEHVYNEMLDCMPPKDWKGTYFELGEPYDIEDGEFLHRAFVKVKGRYYTGHPAAIKALRATKPQ